MTMTRRDLLAGSAGLFTFLTSRVGALAPSDRLNLAFIGIGGRGSENLKELAAHNIVAICDVDWRPIQDPDWRRAAEVASRYPAGKRYVDFRRMLEEMHRTIDAVVISTPDHTHAVAAIAAMRMGKHVFCEKPLALNQIELNEIAAALEKPGAPLLMVGFNRRFAPLAVQMKAFLDRRHEQIYAHYRINAGFIPLGHWVHDPLQGGGRILGESCHFIDFITFLVGAPPTAVSALALPDNGRYAEDNVSLSFEFPDGSVGTVAYMANGDKSFPKERVEVFAGGRVAVLDDFRMLEMVHDGNRQAVHSRLRQDKGHQAEWSAFAQAICQGGPAPIPYPHLFGVTQATFAAVEALRSGEKIKISG
jgi:predicted dehydrogenase